MKTILLIILSVAFFGCAGGSGSSDAAGNGAQTPRALKSVFLNYGRYYDLPLNFEVLKLGEPFTFDYNLYAGEAGTSQILAKCRVTITITGSQTAGEIQTSNGSIVWKYDPNYFTTRCAEYGNLRAVFQSNTEGIVAQMSGGVPFQLYPL